MAVPRRSQVLDLANALQATHAQPQSSFQGEAFVLARCGQDKRLRWAAIEIPTVRADVTGYRYLSHLKRARDMTIVKANVVMLIGANPLGTAYNSHTSLLSMYSYRVTSKLNLFRPVT